MARYIFEHMLSLEVGDAVRRSLPPQAVDAPTSVSGDASKEFTFGITQDMEQRLRERLLDVSKDDVQRVAQQYLVDLPADKRSVCILGEKKEWIGQDPEPWQVRQLKMATDATM